MQSAPFATCQILDWFTAENRKISMWIVRWMESFLIDPWRDEAALCRTSPLTFLRGLSCHSFYICFFNVRPLGRLRLTRVRSNRHRFRKWHEYNGIRNQNGDQPQNIKTPTRNLCRLGKTPWSHLCHENTYKFNMAAFTVQGARNKL